MFKKKYLTYYNNKSKINKKIELKNFKKINHGNYLYNLELIIKIPSILENKQKFLIMLILMDKYLNNKLTFLIDTKTISRTKPIKIGCIIHLTNEMLYLFLNLHLSHNIYKINKNDVTFHFSESKQMRYEVNKILSNLIFHFDEDTTFYYDYLNDFKYEITFYFKSVFNNSMYNRLLLSQFGIYFYNSLNFNTHSIIDSNIFNLLMSEDNKNADNNIDNTDINDEFNELDLLLIKDELMDNDFIKINN